MSEQASRPPPPASRRRGWEQISGRSGQEGTAGTGPSAWRQKGHRHRGGRTRRGGGGAGARQWRSREARAQPSGHSNPRAHGGHPTRTAKNYEAIKRAHATAVSEHRFCAQVQRLKGRRADLWHMSLHVCAEKDDLKLMEWILSHHLKKYSANELKRLVNLPFGRHDYTPLCRAAYAGSIKMMKLLVGNEADVSFVNRHGENIQHCLAAGVENAVKRMDAGAIFIRPRYEACVAYVKKRKAWLAAQTGVKERAQQRRENGNVFYPVRIRRRRAAAAEKLQAWWCRALSRTKKGGKKKDPPPLPAAVPHDDCCSPLPRPGDVAAHEAPPKK